MIIHKFGGTSIQDADGFLATAEIIRDHNQLCDAESSSGMVIVLSPISGVQSSLVQGARLAADGMEDGFREIKQSLLARHISIVEELPVPVRQQRILAGTMEEYLHELERMYRSVAILGELTLRGLNTVKTIGPLLSTHILGALLQNQGVRAQPVNTADVLILDTSSGEPVPQIALTRERALQHLMPLLNDGMLPICTASIGSTSRGVRTMLDRGGGDTSAAALAAALHAQECCIWTDVEGILTADPAFVQEAAAIPNLSHAQAGEMARFGADVIHPATLLPGNELNFTLRIRSSFNPEHPGTTIARSSDQSEPKPPAILSMTGLSMVSIQFDQSSWSIRSATRVLETLYHNGIDILMFSQPMSSPGLMLILRDRDTDYALKCLKQSTGPEVSGTVSFEVAQRAALITVVSLHDGASRPDHNLFSNAFKIVGEQYTVIHAAAHSASGDSFSFCIPEEQCEKLIVHLYSSLVME